MRKIYDFLFSLEAPCFFALAVLPTGFSLKEEARETHAFFFNNENVNQSLGLKEEDKDSARIIVFFFFNGAKLKVMEMY